MDNPIPADLACPESGPPLTEEAIQGAIERHGPDGLVALADTSIETPEPLPGDPPELEADLEVARWLPDTDDDAEWLMALLNGANKTLRGVKEQADAWRSRIDAWEVAQSREPTRTVEFAEAHLIAYAEAARRDQGRKTVALPSGRVQTRVSRSKVVVVDDDDVLAWADTLPEADRDDVVRVKRSIKLAEFRGRCQLIERLADKSDPDAGFEWVVVDKTTGEVVPGVAIQEETLSTTVQPEVGR